MWVWRRRPEWPQKLLKHRETLPYFVHAECPGRHSALFLDILHVQRPQILLASTVNKKLPGKAPNSYAIFSAIKCGFLRDFDPGPAG